MVKVAGEVTTQAKIDYEKVVRGVVAEVGCDSYVDADCMGPERRVRDAARPWLDPAAFAGEAALVHAKAAPPSRRRRRYLFKAAYRQESGLPSGGRAQVLHPRDHRLRGSVFGPAR